MIMGSMSVVVLENKVFTSISEVTKNLQVQFVNYANWFDRKEILRCLEELFS